MSRESRGTTTSAAAGGRAGRTGARLPVAGSSGPGSGAAPSGADSGGAASVIWIALVALACARLALAFVPTMWAWGLNLQRFLDPALAWPPWLIGALALLPWIARRMERPSARIGDGLARSVIAALGLAAATAALVWEHPDQVRFMGDFGLREGVASQVMRPEVLFPQAFALDVLLHYHLPGALLRVAGIHATLTARALGALEAALLALLAVSFVRVLALRGAAALAAWAVVVFGGYLGMFTGYSKASSELVVLTAAVGVFGVRVAREGRGQIGLGIALALALALHRSALMLVPAAAFAWAIGARHAGGAWRRPLNWIAVAIPLIVLAGVARLMVSRVIHTDFGVLVAPAEVRQRGLLGAAFAPARIADIFDLIVLLSPLALVAPLVAWRLGRARLRGREWSVLLALVVPHVLLLLAIHPPQGMFRDWDVFAGAGVALSLIAAALTGEALRSAPGRGWVGVAVTLALFMPATQWLAHFTDVPLGMLRVRAYLSEPPARGAAELGANWDYIGLFHYGTGHWDEAAAAWARAAETVPSRRILDQWMRAELKRGDLRAAQAVLHRMVARDSTDVQGWLGLAAVASRIPDVEDSRRAVRKVLELKPESREAREIEAYLDRNYPRGR